MNSMTVETATGGIDKKTSTQERGIHIRPRLPDIEFDERLPRNHTGSIGETAFANMAGVFANVAEKMFIRSGNLMLPLVGQREYEQELANFIAQEAYHSRVHERMNKVLRTKRYPVEEFRSFAQRIVDEIFENAGHRMILAASLAGEQAIGLFGDALLEHPSALEKWNEQVKRLLLWHAYEEVEHTAALFDSFHLAVGDRDNAYKLRMWGLAYLTVVLASVWGAGLFVFMQHEGSREGWKLRNWRDVGSFFFGERGVFSKSGGHLKDYLRRDFHPWDGRSAHELLEKHKTYVSPDWDMTGKVKQKPVRETNAISAETLRKDVNNWVEGACFVRFLLNAGYLTGRFFLKSTAKRFWREDRKAYEARAVPVTG